MTSNMCQLPPWASASFKVQDNSFYLESRLSPTVVHLRVKRLSLKVETSSRLDLYQ